MADLDPGQIPAQPWRAGCEQDPDRLNFKAALPDKRYNLLTRVVQRCSLPPHCQRPSIWGAGKIVQQRSSSGSIYKSCTFATGLLVESFS